MRHKVPALLSKNPFSIIKFYSLIVSYYAAPLQVKANRSFLWLMARRVAPLLLVRSRHLSCTQQTIHMTLNRFSLAFLHLITFEPREFSIMDLQNILTNISAYLYLRLNLRQLSTALVLLSLNFSHLTFFSCKIESLHFSIWFKSLATFCKF